MKSLRELVGVMAGRDSWRSMPRPRADQRRFRPLAEPMEGRAMLSPAGVGGAVHSVLGALDTSGSNDQVEVQPGDTAYVALYVGGEPR
jgi:hypothetical protein